MSPNELRGLSIKDLRVLITSAGLTTAGCVDKADLIERAAEACALPATHADEPSAKEIEEAVRMLPLAELLPQLEATLKTTPSQSSALHANACLERLTTALMEGDADATAAPPDRLMTAILGGMKMGLGGQGGLFTMACLPLPHVLMRPNANEDDDDASTPDLQVLIDAAEEANGTTLFETLLSGLLKFEQSEDFLGSIMTTMRVFLSCLIENVGDEDMVALCDGDPAHLFEMLNAGLIPAVIKPMRRFPREPQVVSAGLAILSAVCGYHPPEAVETIVLSAGAMPPIIDAHLHFSSDLEVIGACMPLLKALTQREPGRKAARAAGADAALRDLVVKHPSEPELRAEANTILESLGQAPAGSKSQGRAVGAKSAVAKQGKQQQGAGASKTRNKKQHIECINAVYLY
uniref:SAP domain-containing protein n=1 Tax=Coccolithus braarudii TaxID=221442 RepID=A0A7S0Q3W2_9EUKA|mmetsp:Transcript_45158/g.96013  ORF Transcript_45158/g.96013 Transcript_45158/m.96013 type:complete len:406 (+) Transcript_45158:222-1439(+)|eukprot:CAMPEP_0183352294 /NCGR_PEP_ID=MMETSP0164_2-20130417/29012_1 /TAXON_ID=221442 /ORGANISM="Coccolithus pelagicus ssp braarudi, Strain PLY182g" /LENGTH=405 /DNA_ID=CAMNT_0025524689 /DNA_START=211 /DNA_END=1428 /DNA_ORIENTATION=+